MSKSATKDKSRKKIKVSASYKKTMINFISPLLIHFSLTIITCLVMFVTDMNIQSNYFIVILPLAFSYLASSYFVGKQIRKNGIFVGNIYNILPTVIYIITSLSLNSFNFDYRLFLIIALHLAISSIGGIIAVNSRQKVSKRKK